MRSSHFGMDAFLFCAETQEVAASGRAAQKRRESHSVARSAASEREKKMEPLDTAFEVTRDDRADSRLTESFVRQVEDHSLPVGKVLKEQSEALGPSDLPPAFVP